MKKYLLLTIFCFFALINFGFANYVFTGFAGGNGTPENPYQIADCNQLQGIRQTSWGSYILINDINCSDTKKWNPPYGFSPINISPFHEYFEFEGNGKKITNLFINYNGSFSGLFGLIYSNSKIKNVELVDVNIIGVYTVGAIVGENSGGVISNSSAKGVVTGEENVGGIVGSNQGSTGIISNSYFIGKVSGVYNVGGVVGGNETLLVNSYFSGTIKSTNSYAGGLVGNNYGIVNYSYADGNFIQGVDLVGGLIGFNQGELKNSFSSVKVIGNNSIGGLIGYNYGLVENSFWLQTPLINTSLEKCGDSTCTNDSMISDKTYFYNKLNSPLNSWTWKTNEIDGNWVSVANIFPVLGWQKKDGVCGNAQNIPASSPPTLDLCDINGSVPLVTTNPTNYVWNCTGVFGGASVDCNTRRYTENSLYGGGEGTLTNPYLIKDCNQLQNVKENPHKHFVVNNTIDCIATKTWNGGLGFYPIYKTPFYDFDSNIFRNGKFEGTFDGRNFEIKNLNIYREEALIGVGLFAQVDTNGIVKNVKLKDNNILGSGPVVGAIAAFNSGKIINCQTTGVVKSKNSNNGSVGGLVGYNYYGLVFGNSTLGNTTVNGCTGGVGGLIGLNQFGKVFNNYTKGETNSPGCGSVGGLIGKNYGVFGLDASEALDGSIFNNYTTGKTVGNGRATGGLIGENTGANIFYNYTLGQVNGLESTGGLIGEHAGGEVYNNYSLGAINGGITSSNTGTGGLIGWAHDLNAWSTGTYIPANIYNNYTKSVIIGGLYATGGLIGTSMDVFNISNNYSRGNVTGRSSTGGLIGAYISGYQTSFVENNYSAASVTRLSGTTNGIPHIQVGGFAGYFSGNVIIKNNFSTGIVTPNGSETVNGPYAAEFVSTMGDINIYQNWWDNPTTPTPSIPKAKRCFSGGSFEIIDGIPTSIGGTLVTCDSNNRAEGDYVFKPLSTGYLIYGAFPNWTWQKGNWYNGNGSYYDPLTGEYIPPIDGNWIIDYYIINNNYPILSWQINAACGPAAYIDLENIFTNISSDNNLLCAKGKLLPNSFVTNSSGPRWTCESNELIDIYNYGADINCFLSLCGNGVCDLSRGENNLICPQDCFGTNGVCGLTENSCEEGIFISRDDNLTHFKWDCDGVNGGSLVSCNIIIPSIIDTCGNGIMDAGENCSNCVSDVKCSFGQECVKGNCSRVNSISKFDLFIDSNKLYATIKCLFNVNSDVNVFVNDSQINNFNLDCNQTERNILVGNIDEDDATYKVNISINPICDVCSREDYIYLEKEQETNIPDWNIFSLLFIVFAVGFIFISSKRKN